MYRSALNRAHDKIDYLQAATKRAIEREDYICARFLSENVIRYRKVVYWLHLKLEDACH